MGNTNHKMLGFIEERILAAANIAHPNENWESYSAMRFSCRSDMGEEFNLYDFGCFSSLRIGLDRKGISVRWVSEATGERGNVWIVCACPPSGLISEEFLEKMIFLKNESLPDLLIDIVGALVKSGDIK